MRKPLPNEQTMTIPASSVKKPGPAVPDPSLERFNRVKPVVQEILKMILDKNLLFSDMPYLKQEMARQLEIMTKNIVIDMANDVFKLMDDSLQIAFEKAEKKLWEVTDLTKVSVADAERVLNKK